MENTKIVVYFFLLLLLLLYFFFVRFPPSLLATRHMLISCFPFVHLMHASSDKDVGIDNPNFHGEWLELLQLNFL